MRIVRGVVKDYDWGRVDGLADWCGGPSGGPQAELWFGAHPAGPAPVIDGDRPVGVLTDHLASEDAPLLVKVLAAGAPLSLQVHPDAALAASGFAAQAPDGPEVFADRFEKTEMIVALEPFEALVGWRDAHLAADVLSGCGLPDDVVGPVRAGDHAAAVRALLGMSRSDSAPAVARTVDAALAAGLAPEAVAALARTARAYPDDPGVFVAVLLEHVELAAGDAAYVPAGVPHSYVEGLGLEVMTSSDNVLRLGLTRKLVSVDDAVAAFRDDRRAVILRGDGTDVAPPGAPFRVSLRREGTWPAASGGYRVVLALEGSVSVSSGGRVATLSPGTAAVLMAGEPAATVAVDGLVALVYGEGPRG